MMGLDEEIPRKKLKIMPKLLAAQKATSKPVKNTNAYYHEGEKEAKTKDYSKLELKPDHVNRPLWACGDGRIFLETFSTFYKQASDFLLSVAEPICRPENMHEYQLTPRSLYAAVAAGIETKKIISVLNILSKTEIPKELIDFIEASTTNCGKVKLILRKNRYFVKSSSPKVLKILLKDEVISQAKISPEGSKEKTGHIAITDLATVEDETEIHSFEVNPTQVENVKQRCLPSALNYPMLEEYDYKNDSVNPSLDIELKPQGQPRPYQKKSLSKMFANGRARSGIIVLPCGAGKSLVGVTAATIMKKSCLCLVTNNVSVDQWAFQFKLWSTIREEQIGRFTLKYKERFRDNAGVLVATYNMIAYSGNRSQESEKMMNEIRSREWGLLLLDEVHVVPANMFRKAIGSVKCHCKLGLTATLVREDELITDLNFLIGPKLYEANWLELAKEGYIANVSCAEVRCPMTKEFFVEYLKKENSDKKQALYVMNPNKFRSCEFLIQFHEQRGDKIIVFADNIFALHTYAMHLRKPMICGSTSHDERTHILDVFKNRQDIKTVFLSKVGDNSIDIPEANVIIQISSHAGSRRQEAQRLGRILRAKGSHEDRMAGGKEEHNAFFYSLVSTDTKEMYFSTKRQRFLVDQGYSFKVIASLLPPDSGADLSFRRLEDQLSLLQEVMSASDDKIGVEILEEDEDDVALKQTKSFEKTKRASGAKNKQQSQKAKPKKRHHLLEGRGK